MSFSQFIKGRIQGGKYAFNGAVSLIKNEPSIKVQIFLAFLMTVIGFLFQITATEWMLQIFAIGLILTAEGLNSAIEEICDFIHPDHHAKIGHIKDIAAGAVFFAAIIAVIIGIIIYAPYFLAVF